MVNEHLQSSEWRNFFHSHYNIRCSHIYRFKDGEEILSSSRHKIIYEEETETASLVIKNLNLEDSGEYNIIAKNEVGTDSQFVTLQVKGKGL